MTKHLISQDIKDMLTEYKKKNNDYYKALKEFPKWSVPLISQSMQIALGRATSAKEQAYISEQAYEVLAYQKLYTFLKNNSNVRLGMKLETLKAVCASTGVSPDQIIGEVQMKQNTLRTNKMM